MPSPSALPRQHTVPRQHTRVNLCELKSRIAKKLGQDRSNRYFTYLNQFISRKLTKQDFTKQCLSILGHENIQLHNNLIRSIFKNAILSKSPPHNSHEKTQLKNSCPNFTSIWSNGGILPPSPRKIRSGLREKRSRDHLGCPNGHANTEPNTNFALIDDSIKENGIPPKKARTDKISEKDRMFVQNREKEGTFCLDKGSIRAPLGRPLCPASVGSARTGTGTNTSSDYCSSTGQLCDSGNLRNRMERVVREQGLDGVGIDCADLLNRGLDLYLKQVIRSCTGLTRSVNLVSLQNFTVAMQLNPRLLGEDSQLIFEKICFRSFDQE